MQGAKVAKQDSPVAIPDRTKNNQVRKDVFGNPAAEPFQSTIPQVNRRMTVVRIAVARLESMAATPILASIAVAPAKSADRRDHVIQWFFICFLSELARAILRFAVAARSPTVF